MDKKTMSERDICTKFITPAIVSADWDIQKQVREEFSFTKGRIMVRGKLHTRCKARRADFTCITSSICPWPYLATRTRCASPPRPSGGTRWRD